jgi:hypothetical protein
MDDQKTRDLSVEAGVPSSIALKFVEVINAGDSLELIKLQTEDFTFIDMTGDKYSGRNGWSDYFASFPNYQIHVQLILTSGNGVAIIGKTTGSHIPLEVNNPRHLCTSSCRSKSAVLTSS